MKWVSKKLFISLFLLLHSLNAIPTDRQYLSGADAANTVDWQFKCTGGQNSGTWTTIPVPSCWEQEGFGNYNYGRHRSKSDEQGLYRHDFTVPSDWKGKRIFLRFDGSMTDTDVKVNGQSAGATHQGAFYSFAYEITDKINFDGSNRLDVTVSKESSNESVNSAERMADYWVFGGIFRPVYLQAYPQEFISRIATNPRANGDISLDVFLDGLGSNASIECQVKTLDGTGVGSPFTGTAAANSNKVRLNSKIDGVKSWNAENPHLYEIDVSIVRNGKTIHTHSERIAFRTIKIVDGDGIYVNNRKMKFRGINRHAFRPQTGRSLSRQDMIDDILLMKRTNFNAVRNSHYPMDKTFYDLCDSMGLYVIDELAGWQTAYDTKVGEKLVEEMITFNQNHPSILLWSNGNEGGWNSDLDDDFGYWDMQNRPLIHTKNESFNGFNTRHYRTYNGYKNDINGGLIVLPTEFLHGRYDGGHGAGIEDYWNLFRESKNCAGGFLWVLADEGIERTDKNGEIDTEGHQAPDGIFGPYHEPEGSFYTIREVFSPVHIPMDELSDDFNGTIELENRYDFTNLNQCSFTWKLGNFEFAADTGYTVTNEGTVKPGSIPAQKSGSISLELPNNWKENDLLVLEATDHTGMHILTKTWMITSQSQMRETIVDSLETSPIRVVQNDSQISLTNDEFIYRFQKENGQIWRVWRNGQRYSLENGPSITTGNATVDSFTVEENGNATELTFHYSGNLKRVTWTMQTSGWLSMEYRYSLKGEYDYFGVNFTYPEEKVEGIQWLGEGPHRVWKNRMRGTTHNVINRAYNNAVTGVDWSYPEFKGYFADTYWAKLKTTEGSIFCVMDSSDIFLRLFTPETPSEPGKESVIFPDGDISFLHGISPIGSTFQFPYNTGDMGKPHTVNETYSNRIWFYFGDLPEMEVAFESPTRIAPKKLTFSTMQSGGFQLVNPEKSTISVDLYSLSGRKVASLFDGSAEAGTLNLTTPPLAKGIYLYRVTKGREVKLQGTIPVL